MKYIRIGVLGNVDSAKTTLISVLKNNILDNGRGSARAKVFKHKHEIDSGRTSSINHTHIKNSSGDMNVYGAIDGVRIDNANGRVGGHLRFFTNTDSDGIPKERIRIDSSGAVMVATTNNDVASTSGTGNEGHVFPVGAPAQHAVSNSVCLDLNRKTSDGVIVNLRKNGSSVGSISTNANSLPSDKNFKRDIKDLNIGLNLVSQLQPKSFNLIVDDENSPVMYGLVAQDLEIALEKVGVTKNSAWILQHEEKNDAKESDYSLDYSKLIPILINAIKELEAEVKTLKGK